MNSDAIQAVYLFWQQFIPSVFDDRFYQALTIGTVLATFYLLYCTVIRLINLFGG